MHCGRVQKCALEALTALSSSPGKSVFRQKVTSVEEKAEGLVSGRNIYRVSSSLCVSGAKQKFGDVFTVLIHYLDNPDSDPTVSCVCFMSMYTAIIILSINMLLTNQELQGGDDI